MSDRIIIELDRISKTINKTQVFNELSLRIEENSMTGIYGRNGSGKSVLSEILAGVIEPGSGSVISKDGGCRVSVVSSSERLRLLEQERRNDDSEFMQGRTDPGRAVRELLYSRGTSGDRWIELIQEFELTKILDRGLRFLSTGEFRKVLLVRALLERPDLLVLDDPFTGLDPGMRAELHELISRISAENQALVIISGRLSDFSGLATDIRLLEDGRLRDWPIDDKPSVPRLRQDFQAGIPGGRIIQARELIRMQGVGLSYYELKVLTDINWTVTSGEHWQIRGRNGSGKSSLLALISGDSPKAYGQNLYMFGQRRGSGETVWDIKKRIGTVSGALQYDHRINQNVISVAVSGYFDSIGLYEKPDPVQIERAEHWCEQFGLAEYLKCPFRALSEGLKRKVLIIRAVIKNPDLLILDEPCQGLDDYNSAVVLDTVELLIENNHSTLLYVSHDPEYGINSITNVMDLLPHKDGGYTNSCF